MAGRQLPCEGFFSLRAACRVHELLLAVGPLLLVHFDAIGGTDLDSRLAAGL